MLHGRIARQKPWLTKKYVKISLKFVKKHLDDSPASHAVFCDNESKVCFFEAICKLL